MNKIAFIRGYMCKEAKGEFAQHLADAVPLGLYAGIPYAGGYATGALHGNVNAPTSKDLKVIQSEYVKLKLAQAIEELDGIKKRQIMEGEVGNAKGSLRI